MAELSAAAVGAGRQVGPRRPQLAAWSALCLFLLCGGASHFQSVECYRLFSTPWLFSDPRHGTASLAFELWIPTLFVSILAALCIAIWAAIRREWLGVVLAVMVILWMSWLSPIPLAYSAGRYRLLTRSAFHKRLCNEMQALYERAERADPGGADAFLQHFVGNFDGYPCIAKTRPYDIWLARRGNGIGIMFGRRNGYSLQDFSIGGRHVAVLYFHAPDLAHPQIVAVSGLR